MQSSLYGREYTCALLGHLLCSSQSLRLCTIFLLVSAHRRVFGLSLALGGGEERLGTVVFAEAIVYWVLLLLTHYLNELPYII